MPQIAQIAEIYASQLFWLAIFFGAIFFVVGLGMVPKIQATVDARDAQIAADLKTAEGARGPPTRWRRIIARRWTRAGPKRRSSPPRPRPSAAKATEAQVGEADKAIARQDRRGDRQGSREARARRAARDRSGRRRAARELIVSGCRAHVDADTARAAVAKELAHG